MFLPITLASTTDALVALRRISSFLRAEELPVPYTIDPSRDVALDVDGDFTWETIRKGDEGPKFLHGHKKPGEKGKAGNGKKEKADRKKKDAQSSVLPTTTDDAEESELEEKEREKEPLEEKPFELKNQIGRAHV